MANPAPQVDRHYQALFLHSRLGPKVLGKMLDEAEFFTLPANQEQSVQQGHCKVLLARCGIGFGLDGERYVNALKPIALQAPINEEQGD